MKHPVQFQIDTSIKYFKVPTQPNILCYHLK